MKSKTWVLLLAVVLLICGGLSLLLLRPGQNAVRAEVWSEGKMLYTLDLAVDREVTVTTEQGSNTVTVRDGKIAVTDADCPDHYCMARGWCSGGAQIVCLPNRLVIKFVGEQQIDGVAG